jgi:hypothetical protein
MILGALPAIIAELKVRLILILNLLLIHFVN